MLGGIGLAAKTKGISLFGDDFEAAPGAIEAVELTFIQPIETTWQDLFRGYRKLSAITYSSSLSFIAQLLEFFDEAEIILGSDRIVQWDMAEIMAFQIETTKELREVLGEKKHQGLLDKVEQGQLRFYVSRKHISHEKIYVLEGVGNKRVITGSANMSRAAFGGWQRENILYMNGDEAFLHYIRNFDRLKEDCTDCLSYKALLSVSDDSIDDLPVLNTAQVLVIEPSNEDIRQDALFTLRVDKQSKAMRTLPPKTENGKILLNPQSTITIKRQFTQVHRELEAAKPVRPQLVMDLTSESATLNGKPMDLAPSADDVRNDVRCLVDYMEGFKRFHGDERMMFKKYFAFANWFFVSPFMATMRDFAQKANRTTSPYPVFGLLYGKSKGGKTSFLETLTIMMIGQRLTLSADQFTKTGIDSLKTDVKGVPIVVDDLTQARFSQHGQELIKNDRFGLDTSNCSYPAVVISANEDVKVVMPEIARRTVTCHIQASLTNMEIMTSSLVRRVQNTVGTAFYRCYLHEMLQRVPELIDQMRDEGSESPPDILNLSSKVIFDLLTKYFDGPAPEWVRELKLEDYFSEKEMRSQVITDIRRQWEITPKSFQILRKIDELRYNTGDNHAAKRLVNELPEDLMPKQAQTWVVMNLAKSVDFFGIPFTSRATWLRRLTGK